MNPKNKPNAADGCIYYQTIIVTSINYLDELENKYCIYSYINYKSHFYTPKLKKKGRYIWHNLGENAIILFF